MQRSKRKIRDRGVGEQLLKLYMMLAVITGTVFLIMNFVLILTKVWLDREDY